MDTKAVTTSDLLARRGDPMAHMDDVAQSIESLLAIADALLAGREYFFDHFTAPDAHFFWCCRRATQLNVEISGFPSVAAHFKRMLERPSVKKLLAFENDVNEGFAKTA